MMKEKKKKKKKEARKKEREREGSRIFQEERGNAICDAIVVSTTYEEDTRHTREEKRSFVT